MNHWLNRLLLSPIPIDRPSATRIASAILLPIVYQQGHWQLIFIRRSDHLRHHRGQNAFPGGRRDESDHSLQYTALREAHEEINLAPSQIKILAQLPAQAAGHYFTMTPFIGLIRGRPKLLANPSEVAEIFKLPLDPFLQTRHYQRLPVTFEGHPRLIDFIQVENRIIWGATAAVLYKLAQTVSY